ncbi:extracellular solute-binding protein [Paenibacillus silviterrae]|uniref:extracellular solute-binding protein n=1 Tax=Paenibacillus silviterrae TaxID=3242194 RepID=UPI002543AD5E|nr:extracellular solute-binding protein [Paenibacillus chinjuensis]
MKVKKWGIVSLSAFLAVSAVLAGCAEGNGGEGKSGEPNAAQTSKEVSFPLKEQIKLRMFAQKNPVVKKDYNEMKFFKDMEQKSNVKIEWSYGTASDTVEKMNLLFASNDLPDAFFGPYLMGTNDIVRYGSEGQIIPLEGMIDKYAPNIKALFEKRPEYKKYVTAPDGHIYTIPMISETLENTTPDTMFINKKWLDKLNLKMPTTTDELYEVLKAFRDLDPNGNGKKDEIPFSVLDMKNPIQGPLSLAGAFGKSFPSGNASFFHVENGKLTFAPLLPENKDFLIYMNKLYKEKLLDPELFTQNAQVYQAKQKSNPSIVGVHFVWSNSAIFGSATTDYVAVPPLKGPGGKAGWNRQGPNNTPHGFSITKENKHPEATLQWFDLIYDPKTSMEATWGPFGINLKEENGMFEILKAEGMSDLDFRYSESPGAQAPGAVLKETFDKMKQNEGGKEKADYIKMYQPFQPKEIFPRDVMLNKEDAEKAKQFAVDVTQAKGYLDQALAKIISSDNPEGEWKAMAEQLKKYGIDQYTQMMQSYYDKLK